MSRYDDIVEKLGKTQIPDIDFEEYYKTNFDDKEKIKTIVDYFDELDEFLDNGDVITGDKLPFKKLNDKFRFREGEVTLWSGINGHKKSMLLGYCALDFIKQGRKVCMASFEMKPVKTIARMARQLSGEIKATHENVANLMAITQHNLYVFDHVGEMKPERLLGLIYYCATELKVNHFIIDSMMRVVAGEDSYNEQKDLVVKLCHVAAKSNCHIHLVHHMKKIKEDTPSSRIDAKGSGAISDNVHNSLIVWSNKVDNKELPDVILKCDKQREGEWEGSLALNFDNIGLTFNETYRAEMD